MDKLHYMLMFTIIVFIVIVIVITIRIFNCESKSNSNSNVDLNSNLESNDGDDSLFLEETEKIIKEIPNDLTFMINSITNNQNILKRVIQNIDTKELQTIQIDPSILNATSLIERTIIEMDIIYENSLLLNLMNTEIFSDTDINIKKDIEKFTSPPINILSQPDLKKELESNVNQRFNQKMNEMITKQKMEKKRYGSAEMNQKQIQLEDELEKLRQTRLLKMKTVDETLKNIDLLKSGNNFKPKYNIKESYVLIRINKYKIILNKRYIDLKQKLIDDLNKSIDSVNLIEISNLLSKNQISVPIIENFEEYKNMEENKYNPVLLTLFHIKNQNKLYDEKMNMNKNNT